MRRKACTKPCSGILINVLSKLCSRQNLCFIFLWVKVYIVFECIDTSKVVAVIATLQTKKNGSKTDDQTEKNLGFRRGFKTIGQNFHRYGGRRQTKRYESSTNMKADPGVFLCSHILFSNKIKFLTCTCF